MTMDRELPPAGAGSRKSLSGPTRFRARVAYCLAILAPALLALVALAGLADSASAARRVALVVGIDKYLNISGLANPVRDGKAVATILENNGFDVVRAIDVDLAGFRRALADFKARAEGAEEAIVYYGGHGMSVVRDNDLEDILAPSDAEISCERSASKVVAVKELVAATAGIPKRVILIDACRNNPLKQCQTGTSGFGFTGLGREVLATAKTAPAPDGASRGTGGGGVGRSSAAPPLVVYSTDKNALALDGEVGGHSPFAEVLIRQFEAEPKRPIRELLDRVSALVRRKTAPYFQTPWVLSKGGAPEMCLAGRDCATSEALVAKRAIEQSRRLTELAAREVARGDAVTGMLLALEALPEPADKKRAGAGRARPANPKAQAVLKKALGAQHERFLLKSHAAVTVIGFSPNGRLAMTGDKAGTIRLWEVKTGRLALLLRQKDVINSAEFSPDGRLLAVRSWERTSDKSFETLKVWDTRTGLYVYSDDGRKGDVLAVAWQPKARHKLAISKSASGGAPPSVVIRDLGRGSSHVSIDSRQTLDFPELRKLNLQVEGLYFSPDGRSLALHSSWQISLWNVRQRRMLAKTLVPVNELTGETYSTIAFGPKGNLIVTNSGNPHQNSLIAEMFSTRNGRRVGRIRGLGVPRKLSLSLGSRFALVVSADKAEIWNTGARWERRATLEGHTSEIRDGAISRDGRIAVTISRDRTVRVWNTQTGRQLQVFRWEARTVDNAKIALSPDGRTLVTTHYGQSVARIWSLGPVSQAWQANLRSYSFPLEPANSAIVPNLEKETYDFAHQIVTTTWSDGKTRRFSLTPDVGVLPSPSSDTSDASGARVLRNNNGSTVRMKEDSGHHIAVYTKDNAVHVLDAQTGAEILRWDNQDHPDIYRCVSGGFAWGMAGVAYNATLKQGYVVCGRYFFKVDLGSGKFETVDMSRFIPTFGFANGSSNVFVKTDFSADASVVLMQGGETEGERVTDDIVVWDVVNNRILTRISPPRTGLRTATLSASGRYVAVFTHTWLAGNQERVKRVRIYDARTGVLLRTFKSAPKSTKFGPHNLLHWSKWDVSNKTIRLKLLTYEPSGSNPIMQARALVPRCLTKQQRRDHFLTEATPTWCEDMGKWPYRAKRGRLASLARGLSAARSRTHRQMSASRALRAFLAPFPVKLPKANRRSIRLFRDCPTCPEMVVIPPGRFIMGAPASEDPYFGGEIGPRHRVRIARPFAVGKYEVTVGQYRAFVRETGFRTQIEREGRASGPQCQTGWGKKAGTDWRNSGLQQSDNHPVVCLDWVDAKAYANWLARKTGKPYRLLSEAEWEYVARAGATTAYTWGHKADHTKGHLPQLGHFRKGWRKNWNVAVGSYPANRFGVHDMHGNAWEFVADCYHKDYRGAPKDGKPWMTGDCKRHSMRGGRSGERSSGGDTRTYQKELIVFMNAGFRIARSLP